MIASIIYAIGGFIETIIGLRFVFLLMGANPANNFVNWIYQWSQPFVAPFAGIFNQHVTITGPGVSTVSVFDWTALIAFVVIGLIMGLIGMFFGHRHTTTTV